MMEEHYLDVGHEDERGWEDRHREFLASLEAFPQRPPIIISDRDGKVHDPRGYQKTAVKRIREDVLSGKRRGKLVIGTGGGKTTIAAMLSAGTQSKTLYIGPSIPSTHRGFEEFGNKIPGRRAHWMRDSSALARAGTADADFATGQFLLHDERYTRLDPHLYDLVYFDEAHHYMGPEMSRLAQHFQGVQVHMTATPFNLTHDLSEQVAHNFMVYTSDDLVKNDGFPVWRCWRHIVEDEHLGTARIVAGDFKIEDGEEGAVLNMPHRFAICRRILLEAAEAGQRLLVFLPSVSSSKHFIEKVTELEPTLRGRVAHVDGSQRNNMETIRSLGRGELVAVTCKAWAEESVDERIDGVVLADPSRSAARQLQRIGRAARPEPGKTHTTIHDVVSAIPNLDFTTRQPITVHGLLGKRNYQPGAALNGSDADLSKVAYTGVHRASYAEEIPLTERFFNRDVGFLRNVELAMQTLELFAEQLGVSIVNLVNNPQTYRPTDPKLTIEPAKGRPYEMSFSEVVDALECLNMWDLIRIEVIERIENRMQKVRAEIEAGIQGAPLKQKTKPESRESSPQKPEQAYHFPEVQRVDKVKALMFSELGAHVMRQLTGPIPLQAEDLERIYKSAQSKVPMGKSKAPDWRGPEQSAAFLQEWQTRMEEEYGMKLNIVGANGLAAAHSIQCPQGALQDSEQFRKESIQMWEQVWKRVDFSVNERGRPRPPEREVIERFTKDLGINFRALMRAYELLSKKILTAWKQKNEYRTSIDECLTEAGIRAINDDTRSGFFWGLETHLGSLCGIGYAELINGELVVVPPSRRKLENYCKGYKAYEEMGAVAEDLPPTEAKIYAAIFEEQAGTYVHLNVFEEFELDEDWHFVRAALERLGIQDSVHFQSTMQRLNALVEPKGFHIAWELNPGNMEWLTAITKKT